MQIKKGDCLQMIMIDGNYRYGYVSDSREQGNVLEISLYDEGDSKLNFDAQAEGWTITFSANGQPADLVLTETEKKIVPLLAENLTSNQIAEALGVASVTIRTQLRTMRIKLHLQNKVQLVALCQGLENKLEV